MPALQAASMRSPSNRRLPRIAALVPFLPQAICRFWLCWTGSSSRCRTSAIGPPICRRNRAGAMVVNDQSRYTLNRHVSECVLHSRPQVDDVTLTSVILAAPAFGPPATLPACSKRCAQSTSTLALSSYRSATSRHDAPASIASITRSSKSLEYGLGIDRPLGIESMPLDSFVDKPSGIFPIQSERNTL